MDLRERAEKLKKDVPALVLALKKRETPLLAKIFAGLTVAYALSPVDFIPDFIPVLGYLDDLILLPMLAAITIRLIPEKIMEQSRQEAKGLWEGGKPKKWYFALPVVVIWIALLRLLIKSLLCRT